ncbi:MAG TPA: wax ester/triacylglycerol synthase family O-acyltransferase [Acidimicrobiales bacterium]|nr:wax ester/triacylglycerol synthase family O-acyltransferase [Acidimicrobiales bacterium]
MRTLSGTDSMFLSLESPTNLFQVAALTVLDPSTAPPGTPPPHEALRRVIEDRLDRLGPLCRVYAGAPAGVDHGRWVDRRPDLDHHVRRGALPAPGSERELTAMAAELLARPLDRRRPLWEIHVVEGLEGGLVAGIAKLHHSIVDGVAGIEVTAELMDLAPTAPPPRPALSAVDDEAAPGLPTVLGQAVAHAARRVAPASRLSLRMATAALTLRTRNRHVDAVPPAPFSAPRTALAARVGRRRSVGLAHVDRADVEQVRDATGVSVNDVILHLAGSALRTQLRARGELPERPLVAFVPKSTRTASDTLDTGVNRLSGMLVSLATDVEDPVARLCAIAESASSAKDQERMLGEDLFGELAELVPPALLAPGAELARRVGLTTRRPPFTVVVSSFPGSPVPLYCAGAELVAYHPFGPVVDGAALNVTATSYRDRIAFGLLGGESVPPPQVDRLGRLLQESMTELAKAVANGRRSRRPTVEAREARGALARRSPPAP